MRFFTSDSHFGHKNILKYSERPFDDIGQHDNQLIRNYNLQLLWTDEFYHLGDVALGDITKSLPMVGRILCDYRHLSIGNHDRLFLEYSATHRARFWPEYEKYFNLCVPEDYIYFDLSSGKRQEVRLSHFPYDGDARHGDKHAKYRPVDDGIPLIHGHTHRKEQDTLSKAGTPQMHVGVDAWDYMPVPENTIIDWLESL